MLFYQWQQWSLNYEKYGVFQSQAEEVNEKAMELGYKLVYGFPNKQAAPGLKTIRLDTWRRFVCC